jgi:hypothetical protein
MHTRSLTDTGYNPATDEDREDKSPAYRFRASSRVQQNAIGTKKRATHQNLDMES